MNGECFYCGSFGGLAPTTVLYEGFKNLLSDYIPAAHANGGRDDFLPSEPPFKAIHRDWEVFTPDFFARGPQSFLDAVFRGKPLPEAFPNFEISVVPFHRNAMSTAFDKWLGFWMHSSEFFGKWAQSPPRLDTEMPGNFAHDAKHHLSDLIQPLTADKKLWRARANHLEVAFYSYKPLPLAQMGCNPAFPASRLNRNGQAVLYCAETEQTAISEIRPGRGYVCTTCQLALKRDITVMDLAAPLEEINPFTCADLSWHLDQQRTARNLGDFIAEPLNSGEDKATYSGTQCLSDVFRAMRIDGIRFRSSLDYPTGVKLALFDPNVVTLSRNRLVEIVGTAVDFRDSIDIRLRANAPD